MNLLLPKELAKILNVKAEKIVEFCKKGMPHLQLGNEYRFLEEEATPWYEKNFPSQEKLEEAFVDEKGRTLADYVTFEAIIDVLRVSKDKIYRLSRTGMPYQQVGKKRFFHIDDIVNYFRKGETLTSEIKEEKEEKKQNFAMELAFTGIKNNVCHFNVTINNYTKEVKNKNKNPICAAIHVMNDYTGFSKKQPSLFLRKIENIDHYKKEYLSQDLILRKTFQHFFNSIKSNTNLVTEDDFSFIFSELQKPEPQPEVLFVVDGSYDAKRNKGGAGVIQKVGDKTIGHSFDLPAITSDYSEYMAIYHALQLIKKHKYDKATLATDQMGFVNNMQFGLPIPKRTWEKEQNEKNIMIELRNLCKELKNKVKFVYYKQVKDVDFLYNNAHAFSRFYKDSVVEEDRLVYKHISHCKLSDLQEDKKISIEFFEVKDGFTWFDVIENGEKKDQPVKITGTNISRAALSLATNYCTKKAKSLSITIGKLPTFIDDMKKVIAKGKDKQNLLKMFHKIKSKATLSMEDSHLSILKNDLRIQETA